MHNSTVNISQMVKRQALLLPTNIKSHTAFPLAYLYLTLTHSKGQGQGHAHFDREYLAKVTDMANIAIANTYNVEYGLSFGILAFDPF